MNVLDGFSVALVTQLVQTGRIEIAQGSLEQVTYFVANYLRKEGSGQSLISTTVQALLVCPEVEELFIDDAEMKELITDLGLR